MSAALVEAWVAAYNDRDWSAMRAVLAPGCVYEEIVKPPRRIEGADAIVAVFAAWAKAMPDPHARAVAMIDGGDRIAMEFALEGTESPFGDFRPSGHPPRTFGAIMFTFADNRISEFRAYLDSLALFQVMGIRN
ncbi:MAG: SnoaL-like polyketide cyclase [Solirubrobacteraceae bacterium]|jgi:steroid delta-isomerase-like uncharacterized protein|nr:SnoaL-like polyketide cyclase [Solirubrobacteraceae bacterium]